MINTTLRRLTTCLALAIATLPSLAQIVDLSPTIPSKNRLDTSDQEAINEFAAFHAEQIQSGDPEAIRSSRNALTRPLESGNITLSFRRAYSDAVLPIATTLIESQDAVQRMAGLRIAGLLGTDPSARLAVESMEDADEGVRFFAISALGESLATLSSGSPSLTEPVIIDVVEALGDVIRLHQNPDFADAAVRALTSARRISEPSQASTRSIMVETLAHAMGDRLGGLRAADPGAEKTMIAALRACQAVRNVVFDPQLPPSRNSAIAAIRLGAESIGYVYTRNRAGVIELGEGLEPESALLSMAEQAISRGRIAAKETNVSETTITLQFTRGDERQFAIRTSELIGPESVIVTTYNFDRNAFLRPASED